MNKYLLLAMSIMVCVPIVSGAVRTADSLPPSADSVSGAVRTGDGLPPAADDVAVPDEKNGARGSGRASPFDVASPVAPATSDADRGCCVWKGSPVKCTFTNRGYCKTKAGEAGLPFEFYEGTKCSAVSVCPRSSPGSRSLTPSFMLQRPL